MKVCQCLFTTAIVLAQVLAICVYYNSRNENFYQYVIETGKEGSCTFEFDQDAHKALFMFDNETRLGKGYNEYYIVRVEKYKLSEIIPTTTYEYDSLNITKLMGADQANKICAVQDCSVDPRSVFDGKDQYCSLNLDSFSRMNRCMSPPCEVLPKKSFPCTTLYSYIFSYSIDEMQDYMEPFPSYLIESGVINFFILFSILLVMVQYCITQCCCDKEMIITVS